MGLTTVAGANSTIRNRLKISLHAFLLFVITNYATGQSISSLSPFPYGVEFNPIPPHSGSSFPNPDRNTVVRLVQKTKSLGCHWVRLSIHWQHWLPAPGDTNWQYYDMVFEELHKANLTIMACLNGKHTQLSEDKPPVAGKALTQWLQFSEAVLHRYKKYTQLWEVWNEPNFDAFWEKSPQPKDYHTLAGQTIKIIRQVQPQAKIAIGSLARGDAPFGLALLELPRLDARIFTCHPYSEWPEASMLKVNAPVATPQFYQKLDHELSGLKQKCDSLGLELWQGECGYPGKANSHGWQGLGPWSEQVQAKWLMRRFVTDMLVGVKGFGYFALQDFVLGSKENSKGLLKSDGQEKQAYGVYKNLIARFPNGLIAAPHLPDPKTKIDKEGDFAGFGEKDVIQARFQTPDGNVVSALYFNARMQHSVKPATVNLYFENREDAPLLAADLLQNQVQNLVPVQNGKGFYVVLPCTDYPLFLQYKKSH